MGELDCDSVGVARVGGCSDHPKRQLNARRAPSHAKAVATGSDVWVYEVNHIVAAPHTLLCLWADPMLVVGKMQVAPARVGRGCCGVHEIGETWNGVGVADSTSQAVGE